MSEELNFFKVELKEKGKILDELIKLCGNSTNTLENVYKNYL